MYGLLLAGWLALPIAPLNPVVQDTLDNMALHVTAGVNTSNGIVGTGPDLTVKYEMLAVHPIILRGGLDYRLGRVRSSLYPDGTFHQGLFVLETIYYRGTNHLTGYLGLGMAWGFGHFVPTAMTEQRLFEEDQTYDIDVGTDLGYRITLGLRYQRNFSLEIAITELKPSLVYHSRPEPGVDRIRRETFRNNSFRLSVGYAFTLLK
ncbi:hypothetical protein GF420_16055 [candidate division GN15 bacterium]|nr:hypothetical protein [candidate division GN15 bacterium]